MGFLSGYNYRKKITLDHTKFSSTLIDFPLLVKLTNSNFDFSKSLTSGGLDIRFTSSDGETLLKYEREGFDTSKYGESFLINGTASSDSEWGGAASNAVDKNLSTRWATLYNIPFPHYWAYDLGSGVTKTVRKLRLKPYFAYTGSYIKDWELSGSNLASPVISNDSDWTSITTGQHANNDSWEDYSFSNSISYRHYRLKFTNNWPNTYDYTHNGAIEIEMMELESIFWVKIPSISNTVDTDIYIYYGKLGDSDGQDPTNVWDSYHKGVWHLKETGNGTSGEFIDSKNGYNGTGGGGNSAKCPVPVDTFAYKGQQFNYLQSHFIQLNEETNLKLGTSDFTLSAKFQFISNHTYVLLGMYAGTWQYFYWGGDTGPGSSLLRFRDAAVIDLTANFPVGPINYRWYDMEVTRNGTTFTLYLDGVQMNQQTGISAAISDYGAYKIGSMQGEESYTSYGIIDELRISIGLDRGNAWRSARISSDNNEINTFGNEEEPSIAEEVSTPDSIILTDSWSEDVTGYDINYYDIIGLIDEWTITTDPDTFELSDLLLLSDSWIVETNPKSSDISDSIYLYDIWNAAVAGINQIKFPTKLYTAVQTTKTFFTSLFVGGISSYKYITHLNLAVSNATTYKTDLRVLKLPYTNVEIGSFDDYSVKLDGIEIPDIDYNSVDINLSLNSSPSRASFILARRHDKLNETLSGISSIITNENKVQIYDGTTLLFTGYITEINAHSSNDTISIIAEDCRYKLARESIQFWYGGAYKLDNNYNGIPDDEEGVEEERDIPNYVKFEKNIATALNEIIASIGTIISGHEFFPFTGAFVPEYVKTYNNYASILDELILNTANVNWYIDANERLCFQKNNLGTIKTLNLSSLNLPRHPYDTILNDVQLNKKQSAYAKTIIVKRGKEIIRKWSRQEFNVFAFTPTFSKFLNTVFEKTAFCFQQWGLFSKNKFYVGINKTITAYVSTNEWILQAFINFQWLRTDTTNNLSDITLGSGEPHKTVYMTSYGIQNINTRWEERQKSSNNDESWLVSVQEENYDRCEFLVDMANFELNQSNKLITNANVSILLDAYKYYNIKFSDLINLGNTIQENIYNNNNGFPLNIISINIKFDTRIVTLNLSNNGKTYYEKTSNYLKNYIPPKVTYLYKKEEVVSFSQGV